MDQFAFRSSRGEHVTMSPSSKYATVCHWSTAGISLINAIRPHTTINRVFRKRYLIYCAHLPYLSHLYLLPGRYLITTSGQNPIPTIHSRGIRRKGPEYIPRGHDPKYPLSDSDFKCRRRSSPSGTKFRLSLNAKIRRYLQAGYQSSPKLLACSGPRPEFQRDK